MKKRVFITGCTGQDGYLMCKLLSEKPEDYIIYGFVRRTSHHNPKIKDLLKWDVELIEGDLTDLSSLTRNVKLLRPDYFFNFGAMSHVRISFEEPISTFETTGKGVLNCLEAIRANSPHTRFLQASSSEMFGKVQETPQTEKTPFHPRSPYAVAKIAGYWITVNYREAYNIFAANAICFNHESEFRGLNFVTRKITDGIAQIKCGLANKLELGNLDAERDWMYAKDAIKGTKLILEHNYPDDFVLASGKKHSVREFCDICFKKVGLNYKDYVVINPKFARPSEVDVLLGDYSKARGVLGWEPETSFEQMIEIMLNYDLKRYENQKDN